MAIRFNRLDRASIRALQPGQRIMEHGITAERLRNNEIRFSVNVMVDGQRIHRVIGGESEGVTREQAERAIETFRTKAREGRLDLPTGRKAHRTFSEAADDYITRLEESGGKNVKVKTRQFKLHLKPYFKTQRADRITGFTVQHYVRSRLDAGATQATVNRELATLSHFMNRMAEWKWIRSDDRPKITKGTEPRKKIVILSPEQRSALMRGAIGDQDGTTWLFVAFGLNTAMRHAEILRVRWDEIDFEINRIFIPQAKAGQREQPITASLAAMLKKERDQRNDKAGYVFSVTRKDGKVSYRRRMSRQFERSVIRAKLDPQKVTPHVMRHTAITALVQAGADLPTIQRISGHKTLSMVLRYVHLMGDHIDTAIAAIDTGIFDGFTPKLHTAEIESPKGRAKIVAINRRNAG